MGRYRLIAVDMDGTLLKSDKSIHPDTLRDTAYAAEKGIHIVYSTGRGAAELFPYADLLPGIRWGICTSGAEVYDFQEDRFIYRRGISPEMARRVIETAGEETCMVHFLTERASIVREGMIARMEDYHMEAYRPLYDRVASTVPDMSEEAGKHSSIAKINIYFRSKEERETAAERIGRLPLTVIRADGTTLEITAAGVTKALGLKELSAYLGIAPEETAGIGDGDNDRALLEAAGFSAAMGNASPALREACDLVTDDNDHNGAGKAIRLIADM